MTDENRLSASKTRGNRLIALALVLVAIAAYAAITLRATYGAL